MANALGKPYASLKVLEAEALASRLGRQKLNLNALSQRIKFSRLRQNAAAQSEPLLSAAAVIRLRTPFCLPSASSN
jgi:hypothetical protein